MSKLIVCGDSYMSPRLHVKGTHFSEIFASTCNLDLVCYSRSAMSNGGIILQLLQAIKDKPKLIIFNTTHSDRIEFSIDSSIKYNHIISLADLQYKNYGNNELSCVQHKFQGNLLSDSLITLLNHPDHFNSQHKLTKEKLSSLKNYFQELYIENWKWQQDCMMMYYAIHQLHLSQIPYIWCLDFLHLNKNLSTDWVEPKNNLLKPFHEFCNLPLEIDFKDFGYHTSPKTQQLMADCIINHYNKYFIDIV